MSPALDAAAAWTDLEDRLVPLLHLDAHERALYSHLLRHSHLEGTRALLFTLRGLASRAHLSPHVTRATLHRLDEKGCLRIFEVRSTGHFVEIFSPAEILSRDFQSSGSSSSPPDDSHPRGGSGRILSSSLNPTPQLSNSDQSICEPTRDSQLLTPPSSTPETLSPTPFLATPFLSTPNTRNPTPSFSPIFRLEILHRENFRCFYCLHPLGILHLHLDHIIPRSQGGHSGPDNVVAACPRCNRAKRTTSAEDFLESLLIHRIITGAQFQDRLSHLTFIMNAGTLP